MQFKLRRVGLGLLAGLPVVLLAGGIMYKFSPNPYLSYSGTPTQSSVPEIEETPDDPHGNRRTFKGHESGVFAAAVSPDGKRIASGGRDKSIRFWDFHTGTYQQELTGHEGDVLRLVFSPDGAKLASAGGDNVIKVWDVATG